MLFGYPHRAIQMALPRVQLGWGEWLGLSVALALSGISAAVWANTQRIVIWLMSHGMVEEANIGAVSDGIRQVALGASLAALAAVPLIAVRGMFGIYPWTPVLPLVGYLKRVFQVVMGVADRRIRAVSIASRALATSVARRVSMVATPIIRRLWAALYTLLTHALEGSSLTVGWVQNAASVSVRRASEAFVTGWAVISIPLGFTNRAAALVLGWLWAGVSAVIRYVGRLLSIFARVAGAGWDRLIEVLGYQWRAVSAVARLAGCLVLLAWQAAARTLEFVTKALATVLRAVWVVFSTVACYVFNGVVLTSSSLWAGVMTILGWAGMTLATLLRCVGIVVATPVRYGLKGIDLTSGYLWAITAAALSRLGGHLNCCHSHPAWAGQCRNRRHPNNKRRRKRSCHGTGDARGRRLRRGQTPLPAGPAWGGLRCRGRHPGSKHRVNGSCHRTGVARGRRLLRRQTSWPAGPVRGGGDIHWRVSGRPGPHHRAQPGLDGRGVCPLGYNGCRAQSPGRPPQLLSLPSCMGWTMPQPPPS